MRSCRSHEIVFRIKDSEIVIGMDEIRAAWSERPGMQYRCHKRPPLDEAGIFDIKLLYLLRLN